MAASDTAMGTREDGRPIPRVAHNVAMTMLAVRRQITASIKTAYAIPPSSCTDVLVRSPLAIAKSTAIVPVHARRWRRVNWNGSSTPSISSTADTSLTPQARIARPNPNEASVTNGGISRIKSGGRVPVRAATNSINNHTQHVLLARSDRHRPSGCHFATAAMPKPSRHSSLPTNAVNSMLMAACTAESPLTSATAAKPVTATKCPIPSHFSFRLAS